MQIIIGGFGRSGTTWLSDIISKCLGGIILFEPFHPGVFTSSEEFTYSEEIDVKSIRSHLKSLYNSSPSNPWILRNHLNSPLENHSASFIRYVWSNSKVLGYKTIRGNHSIDRLSKIQESSRVVYIYRHPLAVLASINKRARFWDEFGWQRHKELFFEKALSGAVIRKERWTELRSLLNHLATKNEIIVAMWAVSFAISIEKVQKIEGYFVSYESLYLNPYEEVKMLTKYLNVENDSLHPSYFFTPSMTSMKTLHHLRKYEEDAEVNLNELFWMKEFGVAETEKLLDLCERILQYSKSAHDLARQNNYI